MSATMNYPATLTASIPIAGFKEVYDVATVDNALQQLTSSASEALKSTYEKMLRLDCARALPCPHARRRPRPPGWGCPSGRSRRPPPDRPCGLAPPRSTCVSGATQRGQ